MRVRLVRSKEGEDTACEFRRVLPATLDALEALFADFRRECAARLRHRDCFAAELLLREALTNAIVHGSRCNPARSVDCRLRLDQRRLILAVGDEGEGFDWRTARGREAGASCCSGRGMEIFRKYATRVRFNRKGNAVTILRIFAAEAEPEGD